MSSLSIRSRLIMLVAVMIFGMLTLGSVAYYIASTAENEISNIYEHETLPMRELARIRRLASENSSQIFRAIQHNPDFPYARLHDHPLDAHLGVVEKNIARIDETFTSMKQHLLPDSEESRILAEFEPLYARYANNVLLATIKALRAGDYSNESVAHFLKENGDFEQKMNPILSNLAEAQEQAVKNTFQTSAARNAKMRLVAISTVLFGVLIGLGLAIYIIRSISGPLAEMQKMIVHASTRSDFTGKIKVHRDDEVGQTANAFNDLMQSLQTSLGQVRQRILSVDDAVNTLASATTQAAQASSDTSESAAAMAASVEQLSVSITSVSEHTKEALSIANRAGEYSETGGAVIGTAVSAMSEIAVQVRAVGTTITELGQHSDRISSVVQVIKEVADQTNLLALNAAIEAARAGEQGRGFAVVADEVRKLAERTTTATGEIANMIGDIQSRSRSAVSAMENTIGQLEKGSELANQAGQAIDAIRAANQDVQSAFADINEAMREQGAASYDIAQRVERVAQASEQSNVSAQVSASQAGNIHSLANEMKTTIEQFKV